MLVLHSEELLQVHPLPNPQAGKLPFVGCPILIQRYPSHLAAIFSIHDLRIGHVTVTQTHSSWAVVRCGMKAGHQGICSDWLNEQQPYGYIRIISTGKSSNGVQLGT
jgi:hypothetical protein